MFFSKKTKTPLDEKPPKPPVIVKGLKEIKSMEQLNVGLQIVHRTLGKGIVKYIDLHTIKIDFIEYEPKDLLIDICLKKRLLFNGTDAC